MTWVRRLGALAAVLFVAFVPLTERFDGRRIGSKKFTESVILGEAITALVRDAGAEVLHARELGGTRILFEALVAGEIDAYAEYSGTIEQEILRGEHSGGLEGMRAALAESGVTISEPIGFHNGYGVGMLEARAEALGITRLSDLASHPDLALGFTAEFMDRSDGWPALRDAYGLPQHSVRGMDHDVAYRQLTSGAIDGLDVYTTDADIQYYDLRVLEDDRGHFPRYDAVLLYREELDREAPEIAASMRRLEGTIDEAQMMAMNAEARLQRTPEAEVAAKFLVSHLGLEPSAQDAAPGWVERVGLSTREHLSLVRISFLLAVLVGLPLGVLSAKRARLGAILLGGVGIVQTIPALALLVLLIEPVSALGLRGVGSGSVAAVAALFLYSLLPIVRNTCDGLRDVPGDLIESAHALGLPPRARLFRVELPLAARTILAGLKTALVQNIGFATLGALIGAGGYGQPILTGIRLDDYGLILEGALPAAALALVAQAAFALLERCVISSK